MLQTRDILTQIKDYDNIFGILKQNLAYYTPLLQPLCVNYEFFNELYLNLPTNTEERRAS